MEEDPNFETLVQQFHGETGCELAQCRFFLEASGGNYQNAMQMFHETYGHVDAPPPTRPTRTTTTTTTTTATPNPPPPNQPPTDWLQLPLYVVRASFSLVSAVLGVSLHALGTLTDVTLGRILPPFLSQRLHAAGGALLAAAGAEEPSDAARRVIASFERHYGTIRPHFAACSLRQAMQRSTREARFLLVVLIAPLGGGGGGGGSQPSATASSPLDSFCRSVLTRRDLVERIDARYVTWLGEVRGNGSEASQLLRSLSTTTMSNSSNSSNNDSSSRGETSLPLVALFWPSNDGLTLLAQGYGGVEGERLVRELERAADDHAALVGAAQRQRQETEARQRLRDEQDAAYQAALATDAARQAEVAAQEAALRREQEAAAHRAAELVEAAARVTRRKREAGASLPLEPEVHMVGACAIRVRLPDGSHAVRRFHKTELIRTLFDWVDSLENYPGIRNGPGKYQLVVSYPRRVFGNESESVTLEEAGLFPQAALFVEGMDD